MKLVHKGTQEFSGVNRADVYPSSVEETWLVGQSVTCVVWLCDRSGCFHSPTCRKDERGPGQKAEPVDLKGAHLTSIQVPSF